MCNCVGFTDAVMYWCFVCYDVDQQNFLFYKSNNLYLQIPLYNAVLIPMLVVYLSTILLYPGNQFKATTILNIIHRK